jgi:hypothetical protein
MSEYLHVEKPFLDQLAALGWEVTDQGQGSIPSDPAKSLRTSFREWLLPEIFRDAVCAAKIPSGDSNPAASSWKEHGSRPSQGWFRCRRNPEAACLAT